MAEVRVTQLSAEESLAYYSTNYSYNTFTVPNNVNILKRVELYLREVGSMPGNYTLEIRTTSGGKPTGTVLATVNVTSSGITGSLTYVNFDISPDLAVTPGQKLAVVTKQTSVISLSNAAFLGYDNDASLSSGSGNAGYGTGSGANWYALPGNFTLQLFFDTSGTAPTGVTTDLVDNVTPSSADVDGDVTADGGATITERGVVYSYTNPTPTTADSKKTVAGTTGAFTASLTGLVAGVTYYVRAYAKNSVGTTYGDVLEFDTDSSAPTVVLNSITNIDSVSAVANANVSSDNGSPVTERGIVWDTSTAPTTSDNKVIAGSGTGVFSTALTGLSPATTYYVRAYATNGIGTSYSNEISFSSLDQFLKWAQSLTAGANGTLTKIGIVCKLAFGTSGNLNVKICANNAGEPGAVIQNLPAKVITNTDFAVIELITDVAVTNTTLYWIVVENVLVIGVYEIYLGSNNAGGYANGSLKYVKASAPSTWANASPYNNSDMAFYAYIQPTIGANYALQVKSKRYYK